MAGSEKKPGSIFRAVVMMMNGFTTNQSYVLALSFFLYFELRLYWSCHFITDN